MDCSSFAAKLCQNRNNTDAAPGLSYPNPMPRPFDTDSDSDPDPDLASPLTFLDDLLPIGAKAFIGHVSGGGGADAVWDRGGGLLAGADGVDPVFHVEEFAVGVVVEVGASWT
jgi:hypothetical protein